MTKTEWQDRTTALRERLDRLPDHEHPAVRPLIREHEALMDYGLAHEYTTPKEAARA